VGKKVEAGKSKPAQAGKVYPRCGAHRKYKGIYPPRTGCPVCKEIYELRKEGEKCLK
jgi:hypothetical protein